MKNNAVIRCLPPKEETTLDRRNNSLENWLNSCYHYFGNDIVHCIAQANIIELGEGENILTFWDKSDHESIVDAFFQDSLPYCKPWA